MLVTCGDWDIQTCLNREARVKRIMLPKCLMQWINIKKVFPIKDFVVPATSKPEEKKAAKEEEKGTAKEAGQGQGKAPVSSMVEMLSLMKIPLEGRHHAGIDDAKNISTIVVRLLEKGLQFTRDAVNSI